MKDFSSIAKFSLILIALAALCTFAVAQEDAAGNSADWWIEKGNELFINGSYDEALEAYDEAVKIDPVNGSLWKGKIFIELGRFEDAIECFNRSIDANPQYADSWCLKGGVLAEMGRYDEAIFAFNKTIELDPEDPNAWLDKGGALRALGREDDAEMAITTAVEIYDNAIGQNPNDADTWYRKGLALYTQGEYEEAVLSFDEAIDLGSDFGRLWYHKGLASQALGRETDAAFTRARELGYEVQPALSLAITNVTSVGEDEFIEMTNDWNETQIFEGLTLTIDENESVVIPDFTLEPGELIRFHLGESESNETDVFLNSDLALDDVAGSLILKDSAGRLEKFAAYWTPEETLEEALQSANKAIEIDPMDARSWSGKGFVLSQMAMVTANRSKYNESLQAYDKAIEVADKDTTVLAEAWYGKGYALNLMGNSDEAIKAHDKAIELNQSYAEAWVGKATALSRIGEYDEALLAYDRVFEIYTSDEQRLFDYPYLWHSKARALEKLGLEEEAAQAYDKSVEDADKIIVMVSSGQEFYMNLSEAWQWKGYLLTAMGRDSEAEDAFARARELGFTSPFERMLAITNITAIGEDEFVEITNNLQEAQDLKNWILVVDEDEMQSVILSEYILEPTKKVKVHFGSGDDTEIDLFMNSDIVLNDTAYNVTLKDEAGKEVSFLGFEKVPDGVICVRRG